MGIYIYTTIFGVTMYYRHVRYDVTYYYNIIYRLNDDVRGKTSLKYSLKTYDFVSCSYYIYYDKGNNLLSNIILSLYTHAVVGLSIRRALYLQGEALEFLFFFFLIFDILFRVFFE